jgi:hypothetical protein
MIKIDENSKIEIEDNNYILYYRRKDSNAKKECHKWEINGYFPTLEVLLQDWARNSPAHTVAPLTSLQEVVNCIQKAEERVAKLIKGHHN